MSVVVTIVVLIEPGQDTVTPANLVFRQRAHPIRLCKVIDAEVELCVVYLKYVLAGNPSLCPPTSTVMKKNIPNLVNSA